MLDGGAFPDGGLKKAILPLPVNQPARPARKSNLLFGKWPFLYAVGGGDDPVRFVSPPTMGHRTRLFANPASWQAPVDVLVSATNPTPEAIVAVGEPTLANRDGQTLLYFVYGRVREVDPASGLPDIDMQVGVSPNADAVVRGGLRSAGVCLSGRPPCHRNVVGGDNLSLAVGVQPVRSRGRCELLLKRHYQPGAVSWPRRGFAMALALMSLGCGTDDEGAMNLDAGVPVRLDFVAEVGGQPARCGQAFAGLGVTGATAELADARLYVSQVQVRGTDGVWRSAALTEDGAWQHQNVALLDFEDGSGACIGSGSVETNHTVIGTAPSAFDAVRFSVGVPFGLNHLDSSTAEAPLNTPGMYWAWKAGYKFLRVDWKAPVGAPVSRWNVHVGAGACVSPSKVVAPTAPCGRPNLATVELAGFDASKKIVLNLGALVQGANLSANTPSTAPGCMSQPGEPVDCGPIFQSLGMDFASGLCTGGAAVCAPQSVFSLR